MKFEKLSACDSIALKIKDLLNRRTSKVAAVVYPAELSKKIGMNQYDETGMENQVAIKSTMTTEWYTIQKGTKKVMVADMELKAVLDLIVVEQLEVEEENRVRSQMFRKKDDRTVTAIKNGMMNDPDGGVVEINVGDEYKIVTEGTGGTMVRTVDNKHFWVKPLWHLHTTSN